MEEPPGFHHPQHPRHVFQLRKSLYGFKQAPREWYLKLTGQLLQLAFHGSKTDTSLYYTTSSPLYLLIYVDDILILGPSLSLKSTPSLPLLNTISISKTSDPHLNSSELNFRNTETVSHLFKLTILSILKLLKMEHCKPLPTPSPTTCSASCSPLPDNSRLYRRVVGALQYLNFTRPDIPYDVNQACRSMHSPTIVDWLRLKHLLHYLKGTVTHRLHYACPFPVLLTSFSDADWAGDSSNHRSTSGFLICLGHNLISWSSKKQPTIARSSTEAEYKAIANTMSELIWITSLFRELHIPLPSPTLWCDNIGATYLSTNPVFHARMRHIKIDFPFVREQVALWRLHVGIISGKDQPADLLTKSLHKLCFLQLRTKLNLHLALSLWGDVKDANRSDASNASPVPAGQSNHA